MLYMGGNRVTQSHHAFMRFASFDLGFTPSPQSHFIEFFELVQFKIIQFFVNLG
jgi:hypothetical protein